MAKYYHGVRVQEEATPMATPITSSSGLQVVIGTAPINLAEQPYQAINVPILCNSFAEFEQSFGYSPDYKNYSLCQSADASFKVFAVAPVIFINVLDPKKHKKENAEEEYPVFQREVILKQEGVLLDTIKVKNAGAELISGTDYITSFDGSRKAKVTFLQSGAGSKLGVVTISSTSINPASVTTNDIIGGYDPETGTEMGIETIRQIYPRFDLPPGLLLAPGWSQEPEVGAVLMAKCEGINGVFSCECILDLDTEKAVKYTDCKNVKAESGYNDRHTVVVWPMVKISDQIYAFSAIYGAMIAYTDAINEDVPNLSPSNYMLKVTGAVLKNGKEITLDQEQANWLNGEGIITALRDSIWKAWGNNTSCFPDNKDPKDRWFCCRRFFSWWANSFILTYKSKVDNPANYRLIESICDSENIRGNSYVSQGKCAGARIEFKAEDNPIDGLLNGRLVFQQYLAPYTPAEDIVNVLSFDPEMLSAAIGGK